MKAKIAILCTATLFFLTGCGDGCPHEIKALQKHIASLEAQIADQSQRLDVKKSRDVSMLLHCNRFKDLKILPIAFCDYAAAEAGLDAYKLGHRSSPLYEAALFLRSSLAVAAALSLLVAPVLVLYRHTKKVASEKADLQANLAQIQGQVADAKRAEQEIDARITNAKKELETIGYRVTKAKKELESLHQANKKAEKRVAELDKLAGF
ncbi:MAG: hypothetical protein RBS36_12810 [Thiomicrospira sp.]|jgi:septal ring factor EnvC (AmiA/AmiB activator)|nr:hypothetical protein [Thiomicrospira sp.]